MYDNVTHRALHERVDTSIVKNEVEAEIVRQIQNSGPGMIIEVPNGVEAEIVRKIQNKWPGMIIEVPKEVDPNGLDQHSPGAKVDAGKVRMSLVLDGFKRALTEVGRVGTFGANKYSDNGWMEVENGINRYRDAMYRHLFATDLYDNDSGLSHMAHAAWNMLALLELMERQEKK